MASLAPRSGLLGRRLAAHLLRRATFGPTKAEIDTFADLTADQAVEQLLQFPASPPHPLDPQTGTTWVVLGRTGANSSDEDLKRVINSWFLHFIFDPALPPSLFTKLIFFLHTSFVTGHDVVNTSENFYYTLRLFMFDPLGSYQTLAERICLDNGMNDFLDIGDSRVGNPNNNFVREFFELFTIGKGPSAGPGDYTTFTETDVEEASRILTGFRLSTDWDDPTRMDPVTGLPRCWFDLSWHDNANKTFSARFQNRVIQGKSTPQGMIEEVEEFVDMIFSQPATAQQICRRLYRFFVRHKISQEVETDIIVPMALALEQNNYELAPVLRLLFKSQHFYDGDDADSEDETVGALIKSPLELQTGMSRFFKVPIPDPALDLFASYVEFYGTGMQVALSEACLDLFEPPEVAGYQPVYQEPEFNRLWYSAKSIPARHQIADEMLSGPQYLRADVMAFVSDPAQIPDFAGNDPIGNPGPHPGARIASHLVQTLVDYLLPEPLPQARFEHFEQLLLDGLSPINWMFEWDNYLQTQDPTNVQPQIEKLIRGLLQSVEYQLA